MKIGIFTNAYKPIISGVVNSIDLIRKGLRSLGHKVYIFAPRFSDYRDEEAGVFRFSSLNLTGQVRFPVAIPYSMRIFNIIDRVAPDVIHSHHPFVLGEVGAHFAKKLNVPLIFTFHTQYEQYSHYVPLPQEIVKKVTRTAVKNYLKKCSSIICPSPTIMPYIKEFGVKTPITIIPNAIDLNQFRNRDPIGVKARYEIGDDEKLLIYVGRMGQEKNLEFMLRSFKKAQNEVKNSRLMIVGEGPELEPLREYAGSLELGNKVIFPGRVEYNAIPDYYSAAYAFLITSTTEVKPLAILEAMASGLPVVAVEGAGASDTVNNNTDGLITSLSEDEYAGALVKILKDKKLYESLCRGALETSAGYSIKNMALSLEDLYTKLIVSKSIKKKVIPGTKLKKAQQGYVHIYTGDGKGKTTAALGLALRASGHGLKTEIIQFMKGRYDYGELRAIERIPEINLHQYGRIDFVVKGQEKDVDYREAFRALEKAYEVYSRPDVSILVLDEINVALHFGLLKTEDVLVLIDKKPRHLELVLTGRKVPPEIIEKADLVTEMKEIKHYYNTISLKAREGIEY